MVSGDTKPTSNVLTGTTFLETNTADLYIWDGDSLNIVASDTGAQTFNNKTFTDAVTFKEMSAPGNQADTYGALYVKAKSSSNAIYYKADDETEFDLNPGETQIITLRYSPEDVGTDEAFLYSFSPDYLIHSMPISGSSILPTVTIEPDTLDFSSVQVGAFTEF